MFAVARTPLASPAIKHGFTHAKAFPFHLPALPSPGLGSPMQMTPMSPALLVPAAHVLPNFNNNLPASPMVTTPMSPSMLTPRPAFGRPAVDRAFAMPAYPFPTMVSEGASTPTPGRPRIRPVRGPTGLSTVVSGSVAKSPAGSGLKRKHSQRNGRKTLRLNLEPVVINEEDLLVEAMRLASIEEDQGIQFGPFKSIKGRLSTPWPPTQRKRAWLEHLDAIDMWI
ncbi:hypothetical protein GLOTRDRAFT_128369 [Gloeophyllum trabeum ATCC 11539]|uniref:Uncharacterized protein n=1 Tax=Gloeophyllum trabeum (strain ATCC 11539 / FP-39264 / Madison 617) TaxID=670483 RepID=S7RPG2_GLOTA|nr:uncharacterized protein GLOTRDRAFT_128369 [Gloeophyllum trabeum ATCC 11539]EPQ56425.1 hypothetical protein GLOTRDRAFT_128369 [Gloeophyllum trabeum ATCC 11539]